MYIIIDTLMVHYVINNIQKDLSKSMIYTFEFEDVCMCKKCNTAIISNICNNCKITFYSIDKKIQTDLYK